MLKVCGYLATEYIGLQTTTNTSFLNIIITFHAIKVSYVLMQYMRNWLQSTVMKYTALSIASRLVLFNSIPANYVRFECCIVALCSTYMQAT